MKTNWLMMIVINDNPGIINWVLQSQLVIMVEVVHKIRWLQDVSKTFLDVHSERVLKLGWDICWFSKFGN